MTKAGAAAPTTTKVREERERERRESWKKPRNRRKVSNRCREWWSCRGSTCEAEAAEDGGGGSPRRGSSSVGSAMSK